MLGAADATTIILIIGRYFFIIEISFYLLHWCVEYTYRIDIVQCLSLRSSVRFAVAGVYKGMLIITVSKNDVNMTHNGNHGTNKPVTKVSEEKYARTKRHENNKQKCTIRFSHIK